MTRKSIQNTESDYDRDLMFNNESERINEIDLFVDRNNISVHV